MSSLFQLQYAKVVNGSRLSRRAPRRALRFA